MPQIPSPLRPGDSLSEWSRGVCDAIRSLWPRPSGHVLPRIGGNGTTYSIIDQPGIPGNDTVAAPFEVLDGSAPGTVRINYNSKLYFDLLAPQASPKPFYAIEGLSTPDPGISDGHGGTTPTPHYADPGNFIPTLNFPIWLEGDIDTDTGLVTACTIQHGYTWDVFPKFVGFLNEDSTDPANLPAQYAFYYPIADVIDPLSPEPGKLITIGTGDAATSVKIVQHARTHLFLKDTVYKYQPIKFPVPF